MATNCDQSASRESAVSRRKQNGWKIQIKKKKNLKSQFKQFNFDHLQSELWPLNSLKFAIFKSKMLGIRWKSPAWWRRPASWAPSWPCSETRWRFRPRTIRPVRQSGPSSRQHTKATTVIWNLFFWIRKIWIFLFFFFFTNFLGWQMKYLIGRRDAALLERIASGVAWIDGDSGERSGQTERRQDRPVEPQRRLRPAQRAHRQQPLNLWPRCKPQLILDTFEICTTHSRHGQLTVVQIWQPQVN